VGSNGVLVPSSTWKAVYDPQAGGAAVYVCKNTNSPTYNVVSVAALTSAVGIDPFPALSARAKQTAMPLPEPEPSRHAPGRHPSPRHRNRSLLEPLTGP